MDKLSEISRENTLSGTSSTLKKEELSQVRGELFQFLVLSLLIFSGGGNGYVLNNFLFFTQKLYSDIISTKQC